MSGEILRAGLVAAIASLAACGNGDPGIAIVDAPGAGSAATTIHWTLRRQGATTTCAAVGADEIRIVATREDGLPINQTFQCVLEPGMFTLAPARYALSAELYDSSNSQRLASASTQAVTVPGSGPPPIVQLAFDL